MESQSLLHVPYKVKNSLSGIVKVIKKTEIKTRHDFVAINEVVFRPIFDGDMTLNLISDNAIWNGKMGIVVIRFCIAFQRGSFLHKKDQTYELWACLNP